MAGKKDSECQLVEISIQNNNLFEYFEETFQIIKIVPDQSTLIKEIIFMRK